MTLIRRFPSRLARVRLYTGLAPLPVRKGPLGVYSFLHFAPLSVVASTNQESVHKVCYMNSSLVERDYYDSSSAGGEEVFIGGERRKMPSSITHQVTPAAAPSKWVFSGKILVCTLSHPHTLDQETHSSRTQHDIIHHLSGSREGQKFIRIEQ